MPNMNRSSTRIASTDSAVTPYFAMSIPVSTASPAMNTSAIVRTTRTHRLQYTGKRGETCLTLVASSLIVAAPNAKPPMWAKYGDAPAAAGRVGQVGRAEDRLLGEPDPEHHQRRQLDHGDEEDDEHERQHPGARVEHDVAAEHRGDRARRADRRRRRVRTDRDLQRQRREPADEVEARGT